MRERAGCVRWEARGENGFAACRPGVLWRQERVRAEFSDESATRTRRAGDTNDTNDAFGRTLPLNTLGDVRGNVGEGGEGGARFVRQLATERASLRGDATKPRGSSRPSRRRRASAFVVGGGVVVADECAGGDVDAVFREGGGEAAVTTHQTWPAAHPLASREAAQLEALRPCGETGMPLWLAEEDA